MRRKPVNRRLCPDPDCALCDGPNMWPLDGVAALVGELLSIRSALAAPGKAGST